MSTPTADRFDIVCCSHEPWDDVWRRNQFFVAELLRSHLDLRMLFVEPAVDVAWSLRNRRRPARSGLRPLGDSGRLSVFAPRKWLPRRLRPDADGALARQVLAATRRLGLERPLLWINDSAYARLLPITGWPAVYDVTDDWIVDTDAPAEVARQRRNDAQMLQCAAEVVVCSPALAASRGERRAVHLITNGVDIDHFRRPQPRPPDLPDGPVVLYTGTLARGRLDLALCEQLGIALVGLASLVFVGPNSLSSADAESLAESGAILLGARPYSALPGYLQHADVIVVPHAVNAYTESLDPIKAREITAVGRPAVATPVAGFRELTATVSVVPAETYVDEVIRTLEKSGRAPGPGPMAVAPPSWQAQAEAFGAVLLGARTATRPG